MSRFEPLAEPSGFDQGAAEELEALGHVPIPEDGSWGHFRRSQDRPEEPKSPSPPYPASGSGNCETPLRSTLPGAGKRGPGCGAKKAVGWVSWEDGCLPLGIHSCERRECPRCAKAHTREECEYGIPHGGGDLIHEEALIAGAKLMGYAESTGETLRQVVISPDPSRFSEDADQGETTRRVRIEVRAALKALGWKGSRWGSVVVHLYRGCEADGYDRWGPHAHVVGAGIDVRKTAAYAERTGVVVKQVNDAEARGFASYWGGKLFRHLVYELGHAGTVPNGHSVSYVGRGLIAFKVPEPETPEEERVPPKCPHGHELKVLGTGSRPRYDELTREWCYSAGEGEFFRFLDRAPAQGGPLLERVHRDGRVTQVPIAPYRADDLQPPPYSGHRRKRRYAEET